MRLLILHRKPFTFLLDNPIRLLIHSLSLRKKAELEFHFKSEMNRSKQHYQPELHLSGFYLNSVSL